MNDETTFTPEIIGETKDVDRETITLATMVVYLKPCPTCAKLMIRLSDGGPFQLFPYDLSFKSQVERAGWVYVSDAEVDEKRICHECKAAGRASFVCAMCKETRRMDQEEESFGEPAERLCSVCFETVTAKVWAAKVRELREDHRWDFE